MPGGKETIMDLKPFIAAVSKEGLDIHGVLARQHDTILDSFYWWDGRRDNIHSCSKTVLSLAMGMALEEGLLTMDERVVDIFPEQAPACPSNYLSQLRVGHLMTMTAGYDKLVLHGCQRDWLEDLDWVHYALHYPLVSAPGQRFIYNNCAPILASRAIQKRAGMSLVDYLKPRLFDPLEIPNPQWMTCPLGYTLGVGGLFLNLEEMSRVGQLFLNEGCWKGRRLVPAAYIRDAVRCHVDTAGNPYRSERDSAVGYGYWVWRCARDDAYRAEGIYGQFIIVLPRQDAVIALAAHKEGCTQPILDALWDTVVPQL